MVLVAAALLAAPSIANAAVLDHQASWLVSKIGGLQRQDVQGSVSGPAFGQAILTGAPGSESLQFTAAPLFNTTSNAGGAALFTGVNAISNLFLTVQNGPGTMAQGFTGTWIHGSIGPAFGGVAGQSGQNDI
jgi:hypothetical protein